MNGLPTTGACAFAAPTFHSAPELWQEYSDSVAYAIPMTSLLPQELLDPTASRYTVASFSSRYAN